MLRLCDQGVDRAIRANGQRVGNRSGLLSQWKPGHPKQPAVGAIMTHNLVDQQFPSVAGDHVVYSRIEAVIGAPTNQAHATQTVRNNHLDRDTAGDDLPTCRVSLGRASKRVGTAPVKVSRHGCRSEPPIRIHQPRNSGATMLLHQHFTQIAERDTGQAVLKTQAFW